MVVIELKENYRIRSDARQWIFERTSGMADKNGEINYTPISFHASIDNVLKSSFDYFIRVSDADDFQEMRSIAIELINSYCATLNISKKNIEEFKERII